MIVVLVVASGAAWESEALRWLGDDPTTVVLKRCVDVDDLLATAAAGQAQAAVLGLDAPGLDPPAVEHLRRHGVRPVAVLAGTDDEAARLRAGRLGLRDLVSDRDLAGLPAAVGAAVGDAADADGPGGPADLADAGPASAGQGVVPDTQGRVLVVWGPPGAPGRSTVAVGLAAEIARRGRRTILVDADPHAASIAQQLGILDEVSGLLAAARLAAAGRLEDELASVQRGLGPSLSVVTGLPRPDRWSEVRPGAVAALLAAARDLGHVVVDTGASLEQDQAPDYGLRPGRNTVTLEALGAADEVVAVGSADPVGLARLARGLVDLREVLGPRPVRVVVNRMRPSLGWSERDVAEMVHGFDRIASLHYLPEDQAATDRALVTGRTLLEAGDGALARALADVVDVMAPPSPAEGDALSGPRGARRASGGRAPRRRRDRDGRPPRSGRWSRS